MRFGAARIAIKRKSISKNNILFHQEFGGGTLHCHGEDTIFLRDCLKAGLKVIAIPEYIAELNDTRKSSWFSGYNRKYFFDQDACITACPKDGANFWLYRIVCAITKNIRNLCIFLRYGKQCYVG